MYMIYNAFKYQPLTCGLLIPGNYTFIATGEANWTQDHRGLPKMKDTKMAEFG